MKLLMIAICCALILVPLGIVAVVWAAISISRGEYLTALVVVGFAMFCFGFIVPFLKGVPGKVTPRGVYDCDGTTIRPDRGIEMPMMAGAFGLVVSSGLFAIFFPLGHVDVPLPQEMRIYIPFSCAIAALVGAPILWRMYRRGGMHRLRLTPDGFVVESGGRRPQVGDWAEVADVTDAAPGSLRLMNPTP